MKVQFYQGHELCDRCGKDIANIYVITFDDNSSIKCGTECVKKILKKITNISDMGIKYVAKMMKEINNCQKEIDHAKVAKFKDCPLDGNPNYYDGKAIVYTYANKKQYVFPCESEEKFNEFIEQIVNYNEKRIKEITEELEEKTTKIKKIVSEVAF